MDKNQNDFADRLRRIEAKKGARPVTPKPAAPRRERKPKPERRGGLTPLMLQGLSVLAVVIAGAGAFVWYMLPEWQQRREILAKEAAEEAERPQSASQAAQAFKVQSPLAERRKDDATRFVSDFGWRMWPGEVATPDHSPLSIEVLASGYSPEPDAVPGAITELEPNRRCQLRRPQPGEVVRNIRIRAATGETGLHV
ncbi:MAG: hypothetical protein OIF48_05950, partial [Silicimonas sp.]|nr:hypothetical protein [Silicimonas sp.]